MPTERTADLLISAFKDEMSTRRKYELKDKSGNVLSVLYFPPVTRFDRQKAQSLAGSDEGLVVSTQLLCQTAQKEDGTPAFDMSDAKILQRSLPEEVLNKLELFMMDVQVDIEQAKNE